MALRMNKGLIEALMTNGFTKDQIRRIRISDNVVEEFSMLAEKISRGEAVDPLRFKELSTALLKGYRSHLKKLKRPGERKTKKEQLEKLRPKLDVKKGWITLQVELEHKYNLKVGRTTLLEFLRNSSDSH